MVRRVGDIEVGMILPTNRYGDIQILEVKNARHVRVVFIEYPHEVIVKAANIKSGEVKNIMRPSVHGVGYLGVGPYKTWDGKKCTKAYAVWVDMLDRVYTPENDLIAMWYKETSVHTDWLCFQNFAEWYYKQINRFGEVSFKWHIDKDLTVPGNRLYSAETCAVIPSAVNILMTDHASGRGLYPLGVSSQNKGRSFQAVMTAYGKYQYIGTYKTILEAQLAYWSAKFEVIRNTAIQYWQYLPEPLAYRLLTFDWPDAIAYYGEDAYLRL
jgi:hypothetical protein